MSGYPLLRLGVIGGGQLGRMLISAARELGVAVTVLDPDPEAACAEVADELIVGGLHDPQALSRLAAGCDLLTYEIEHTDVTVLSELAEQGTVIRPAPELLRTIQDKLVQKQHLQDHGVPVPVFETPRSGESLREAAGRLGYPCVCKSRRGGYDGRGVIVCRDAAALAAAGLDQGPGGGWFLERYLEGVHEPAVIVARGLDGAVAVFPPFGTAFHPQRNVCDAVVVPAPLSPEARERAVEIAEAAVRSLAGVGLFAVELFHTAEGELLVNEIAPRPHNSGHVTIEACATSQFEQHLRAVCGLPLGSTRLLSAGAMVNLLAEDCAGGEAVQIEGVREALAVEGVNLHLYGKRRVRPGRKMGHVTALAETAEEALYQARRAAACLRFR